MTGEPLAYTLRDAATKTGLSVQYLRDRIKDGSLRASYAGVKPLIRAVELDRWLESLPSDKPAA